jgi:hypothetical protein
MIHHSSPGPFSEIYQRKVFFALQQLENLFLLQSAKTHTQFTANCHIGDTVNVIA